MAVGSNRSTYQEPVWKAVRSVRLAETSLAHWRNLLGDRFTVARHWLKPTGEMASHIPKRGSNYVWYRVIEDRPHVYIAVDEERGCCVDVEPCDMASYQFDFHRFAELIAGHFGFDLGDRWSDADAAWRMAMDRPMAGISFPVYLQLLDIENGVLHACDECDGPFVFIRWNDEPMDDRTRRRLDRHDAIVLTVDDFASVSDCDELKFSYVAKANVDDFRKRHAPNINAGDPGIRFPTPSGTRWSQVAIQFKSDEAIQVSVGDVSQIYNFAQMGLVDARNGRPTLQWELLRMMAAERGIYTWHSPGACRKNKKRREVLTKKLREFFGIEGDPIELTDDKKGYRTVFKLTPQGD
ncbi:MAG: hypothetical protein AAFV88_06980 [Planctomycetota bacterium]